MKLSQDEISVKDKNKFLLTLFVLPLAPAVILFKFGHLKLALGVLILFWFFGVFSFFNPSFADFLHHNSKKLTKFLGDNLAKAVLFVVYIFCVFPLGLLMKLIKRDRLGLKKKRNGSYWKDVKEEDSSYEYQF